MTRLGSELSDYADESRRFSSFVKLVFNRLRDIGHLPSSTEVNSWFWLFKRRDQYTEAAVPEAALPQTRKVQEALQSVTKDCRSDQEKVERQIEILQRCSEVMSDTRCLIPFQRPWSIPWLKNWRSSRSVDFRRFPMQTSFPVSWTT